MSWPGLQWTSRWLWLISQIVVQISFKHQNPGDWPDDAVWKLKFAGVKETTFERLWSNLITTCCILEHWCTGSFLPPLSLVISPPTLFLLFLLYEPRLEKSLWNHTNTSFQNSGSSNRFRGGVGLRERLEGKEGKEKRWRKETLAANGEIKGYHFRSHLPMILITVASDRPSKTPEQLGSVAGSACNAPINLVSSPLYRGASQI